MVFQAWWEGMMVRRWRQGVGVGLRLWEEGQRVMELGRQRRSGERKWGQH